MTSICTHCYTKLLIVEDGLYTCTTTMVFNTGNTSVFLTIAGEPQRGISLLVLDVNVCTTPEDELHKLVVAFIGGNSEGSIPGAGHRGGIHIRTLGGEGWARGVHLEENCARRLLTLYTGG